MPKFFVVRSYRAHECFEIEAADAETACEIAMDEPRPGRALTAIIPEHLDAVAVYADETCESGVLASWED